MDRAQASELEDVVGRLEAEREVGAGEERGLAEHVPELVLEERPLLAGVQHEDEVAEPGGAREPLATESTAVATAPVSLAGGNKVVGVMSRNLYLGAELTPVIQAQDFGQFIGATTAVWAMVQKNDFHTRAKALADEIAAARPALVGLQEAYTWRDQSPADGMATPATHVVYDYVPELLAELAKRGLVYRNAASVELFDFEAPTGFGVDARMTDHGVILAREDVTTSNPEAHVFSNQPEARHLLPVMVLGETVFVKRGWVSVDVKYRGESFRFVSTHLEAFHPGIRQLQAAELAAALAADPRPTILVGDLNSHPGTEGAAILAASGFQDVWPVLHPGDPGLSCCWLEDLTLPSPPAPPFYERIDYVMTRGPFEPRAEYVTGSDPASRVGGLWPSDHGGVFGELRIADPRFAP